jgi:periplasmic divalent cation tolerance protein
MEETAAVCIQTAMGGFRTIFGMSSEHVIVSSTTDSENSARALAAGAIDAKLGACAQVVGPITSVFRWKGAVQTEQEWRVEIKTAADRVEALTQHIKAHHSYDVPEIIATPITGGSTEYLTWLENETRT